MYDPDLIAERVAGIYGIEPGKILFRGNQQEKVGSSGLRCAWGVNEPGISFVNLTKKSHMNPPAM